jgi:photosystem II stability/assembly factor-like uncharacterized protein
MLLSLALWSSLTFANEGIWERVGSPSRLTTFYDISVCNINSIQWVFAAESSGTSYIWRSNDNGATWVPRRSQVVDHYYKQIIMRPSNDQYGYGWALVPGYTDGDNSAGPYRTTNSGEIWTRSYYQAQHSKRFECLAVDPSDLNFETAYMGTHTMPPSDATKLLKTANGGTNWDPWDTGIAGNGGVTDIALCEGSPQNLYCIFTENGGASHLYYSADAGQNWNRVIGADGVKKVAVHPTNANYIFVVMQDPPNQIKASINGGATWSIPFQNYGNWGPCHSIKFTQLAGYEDYAYFAFNSEGDDGNYHWLVRKNYDPTDPPVELPLSGGWHAFHPCGW